MCANAQSRRGEIGDDGGPPPRKPVNMRNPIGRATYRALVALALTCTFAMPVAAQVMLGTAQTYGVIGGSTVTNTGATVINGDLGVSPGSALVGFPPGTSTGATNVA